MEPSDQPADTFETPSGAQRDEPERRAAWRARQRAAGASRARRPLRLLAAVAALLVLIAALVGLNALRGGAGSAAPPFTGRLNAPGGGRDHRVTAWITSPTRTLATALAARALDEVDCDWYTIGADGAVQAGPENLAMVAKARTLGVQAFATVTNRPSPKGSFDGKIATAILTNPATAQRAVDSLVRLAVSKGYDGIDVDFELVPAKERGAFSSFIARLAEALHAKHRLLSVAVFAKTSEPGQWDSQKSADYAALGRSVDALKIMTYSYSGPWGDPGPQAPLAWTRSVLGFAQSVAPPQKVYMGLPFYGFDWHGGSTTALHSTDVAALLAAHHFKVAHDPASGEADLSYTDPQGVVHVLWFQDRHSIETKARLLQASFPRLGGLSIWEMRDEDPGFWTVLERVLRAPGGATASP